MGGDAFLFLFFWFSQTNKKQQQEKILIPQATQIVLNLFLFKDFFFARLTLDFVHYVQDGMHMQNAQNFTYVRCVTLCTHSGDMQLCRITVVKMFL